MDSIILYVAISGGALTCLQGIGQLVVKNKTQFNYFLGFLNLCGGILLFHFSLELVEGTYDTVRFSDVYEPSINFSLAVLTYFTFRQLINPRHLFTKKDTVHFIPAALSFFVLAIFYVVKLNLPDYTDSSFYNVHLLINYASYVFSSFWLFVYSLVNFKLSYALLVEGKSQYPEAKLATFALLIEVIIITGLMVVASLLMSYTIYKIVCLLAIQLFLTIYLLIHRYPAYVLNIKKAYSKARYEHSKITGLDVDSVVERLSDLMEVEREYEDEDLTLSSLSEMLNITTHQLSQILNEKMGSSFPQFVNRHRLEGARKVIVEDKQQSILSIAFKVGFKSKSAFYNAFKKEFNMTPTEFRNQNK